MVASLFHKDNLRELQTKNSSSRPGETTNRNGKRKKKMTKKKKKSFQIGPAGKDNKCF